MLNTEPMKEQAEIVTETDEDQTTFVLLRAVNALELGMIQAAHHLLLDELRRRLPNCTGRPITESKLCSV